METPEPKDSFKPEPTPDTIPDDGKTKLCSNCKQNIDIEYWKRHQQIHIIAVKFNDKEILANIALTLTEIKSQNDRLLRILIR